VAVAQQDDDDYGCMGPGMMYGYGHHGGYGPRGGYGPDGDYCTGYGPGGWGRGGGWMGPGMMYGYGPGGGWGHGGGWGERQANLNLSVDDVKNRMERWVQSSGNSHIKVGDVIAKDADTIIADIVTADKDDVGAALRYQPAHRSCAARGLIFVDDVVFAPAAQPDEPGSAQRGPRRSLPASVSGGCGPRRRSAGCAVSTHG
jgi:hypothetical protein